MVAAAMSEALPTLGQLVDRRYRVHRILEQDMGSVAYGAEHVFTGRRVLLVLAREEESTERTSRAAFAQLARVRQQTRHPHLAELLDMGLFEAEAAPNLERAYLVLEQPEGLPFQEILGAQPPPLLPELLAYLLPLMGALAVLHDAGVAHGRLGPDAIVLTLGPRGEPRPVLLGLGQADAGAAEMSLDLAAIGSLLQRACPSLPTAVSQAIERAQRCTSSGASHGYACVRAFAESLVAAAVSCGIPLPEDPDPVGLPDYPCWHTRRSALEATHDLCPEEHAAVREARLLGARFDMDSAGPTVPVSGTNERSGGALEVVVPAARLPERALGPRTRRDGRPGRPLLALLLLGLIGASAALWLAREPSYFSFFDVADVTIVSHPASSARGGGKVPNGAPTDLHRAIGISAPEGISESASKDLRGALDVTEAPTKAGDASAPLPRDASSRGLPRSQGGVAMEPEWK
jgi:hypothetical protein